MLHTNVLHIINKLFVWRRWTVLHSLFRLLLSSIWIRLCLLELYYKCSNGKLLVVLVSDWRWNYRLTMHVDGGLAAGCMWLSRFCNKIYSRTLMYMLSLSAVGYTFFIWFGVCALHIIRQYIQFHVPLFLTCSFTYACKRITSMSL